MEPTALINTARAILEQPTAPFHEEAVRAEIERQLSGLSHTSVGRDDFGNLIAVYQNGPVAPRFAFAAHMDHPAYVGDEFLGGVPESYRSKGAPIRAFGAFSMWDLPPFELRDGRIYSRACDDLIGCAAIVSMFQHLAASDAEASCYGLFTRAEEVGFVGAIQLAKSRRIPSNVTIVSLETSSERGGPGRMNDGVIIRVGDRTSIFDSSATATLVQLALKADLPHQRALMSGGTCEATAYQLYDYRTAGICVALGNYHNCAPDEKIGAEFVAVDDVLAMARLCLVAAKAVNLPDPQAVLKARLEERLREYEKYF